MMMNHTLEQLRGLKLNGMAAGLHEQLTPAGLTAMGFAERLDFLLDRAVYFRTSKRPARMRKEDRATFTEMPRRHGMRNLREDGWNKVRRGMTSAEEVMRVTQEL